MKNIYSKNKEICTIISDTPYSKNKNGELVGLDPTVEEIDHLGSLFKKIYHFAPLYNIESPKSFNELVGQHHVSQTLANAIKLNRIAHSYLFAGLRGTGKTTAARIMAKELNQSDVSKISSGRDLDVIELDGASNRGIDEIRDLKESVKYPPVSGKYKIYIIDEVHMLTNEAFNALLKTLEEPPSYVVFILATTDPFKLPATILSRSQRFEFRSLSKTEIHQHLKFVLSEEGLKSDVESLNAISVHSGGSMRDALSLLDQVIAFSSGDIEISLVEEMLGSISQESLMEILLNIHQPFVLSPTVQAGAEQLFKQLTKQLQ